MKGIYSSAPLIPITNIIFFLKHPWMVEGSFLSVYWFFIAFNLSFNYIFGI